MYLGLFKRCLPSSSSCSRHVSSSRFQVVLGDLRRWGASIDTPAKAKSPEFNGASEAPLETDCNRLDGIEPVGGCVDCKLNRVCILFRFQKLKSVLDPFYEEKEKEKPLKKIQNKPKQGIDKKQEKRLRCEKGDGDTTSQIMPLINKVRDFHFHSFFFFFAKYADDMIASVFSYFFGFFFGLFFDFFFFSFPLRFGIMASVRQPLGKIRHIPCSRVPYY